MDEPIKFPDRLGVKTPAEQFAELKSMSSRELLAALLMKVPDLTFTADELRAAKGLSVTVKSVGSNEWRLDVVPVTHQAPLDLCNVNGCVYRPHGAGTPHSWTPRPAS